MSLLPIVNIHEAKTHFSKLVNTVKHGKEVIIALAGEPVARLVPIETKPKREPGVLKGKITIADDFDTQLPDDFFEGVES
jgi:prevent-host-death family protein